ncbi:MAG: hypothetical protein ACREAD_01805 [Nitrosopumilaceae archaeon]
MRLPKSITLDESTWAQIDNLRGDVPRSRFLEKLVIKSITGACK